MASKVGEDVCNKNVQHIGKFSARGSKASKRVVAPQEQGESTRVTRQRTAANPSLAIVTHDALASTNTTTSQNEEHINNNDEGALFASAQHVPRGKYMGKELDALNRGLGTKIKIDIAEGNRRPKAPMQAAKLASEAGISPRLHTPIFPHWKEYKKEHNKHLVEAYIGKVAITFDMDTKSEAVQAACVDMLKGGQRQMRYRLKKKYFDGVPANLVRTTSPVTCMTDDQWRALVEMWSNPKHKKQEKYKDTEPTAIDLFKEMHCSKKSGFCEPVKNAIIAPALCGVWGRVSVSSLTLACAMRGDRDSNPGSSGHRRLLWKQLRLNQCKKASSRCLLLKLFPRCYRSQAHFFKMWGCQPPSQVVEVQLVCRCESYRLNLRLRSKNLRNLSKNLHNLSERWLAKHMKLTIWRRDSKKLMPSFDS